MDILTASLHFSNQKRMNNVIMVLRDMSYLQVVLIWRTPEPGSTCSTTVPLGRLKSRTFVLKKRPEAPPSWMEPVVVTNSGEHKIWNKLLTPYLCPDKGNQATTWLGFRHILLLITCGYEATDVLPLHSHSWGNGQCRICKRCGEKHGEIPTLSHHLFNRQRLYPKN